MVSPWIRGSVICIRCSRWVISREWVQTALNTPNDQRSIYHELAFFAQDKWTIGRRLTINVGARFEHFRTFNPAQTSPAATFPQLFPIRSFPQSPDYVDWNTLQPRIGVAY